MARAAPVERGMGLNSGRPPAPRGAATLSPGRPARRPRRPGLSPPPGHSLALLFQQHRKEKELMFVTHTYRYIYASIHIYTCIYSYIYEWMDG